MIGAHIFYRLPAFAATGRYAGAEPEIALMAPLGSVPMTVPGAQVAAAMAGAPSPAAPSGGATIAMVLPGI